MKIIAGLPFRQSFVLPEYLEADGWSILGYLSNASSTHALSASLFESVDNGWRLSIPSTTTAPWPAGTYMIYLVAVDANGDEELAATLAATVEALGSVSHSKKMVDAIRALMEGRTATAYESYTTEDGESITRIPPEKLMAWLAYYERRLSGEQRTGTSGGRVKTIQIGFGS